MPQERMALTGSLTAIAFVLLITALVAGRRTHGPPSRAARIVIPVPVGLAGLFSSAVLVRLPRGRRLHGRNTAVVVTALEAIRK
jgi:hypothetical protein